MVVEGLENDGCLGKQGFLVSFNCLFKSTHQILLSLGVFSAKSQQKTFVCFDLSQFIIDNVLVKNQFAQNHGSLVCDFQPFSFGYNFFLIIGFKSSLGLQFGLDKFVKDVNSLRLSFLNVIIQ